MTTIKQLYEFAKKHGCHNEQIIQFFNPNSDKYVLGTMFPDDGGMSISLNGEHEMTAEHQSGYDSPEIVERWEDDE